VKQLQGTASGSRIGKLSGTILRNNYFEEQQLWGAAFDHFGEQLSAITLGSNFRELFWGIDLKNYSFGAITLDSSFVDNFGEQFRGIILWNDNFPEKF
jgi:hypothetical protein